MRCLLGVVFGVLLAVSATRAQQVTSSDVPASKQDIERLFVALHVRERQQLILENSHKQAKTMFNEILQKELPEASKEERTQLQGMVDEMIDDIDRDYPMDAILKDMVPIYQRHLTKSDSDELIAFYSSPIGQKVLRELPAITTEAMQVSSAYLQPRMEVAVSKLKEKVERMAEEDRKKKDGNSTETEPKKN
jgi:uncharacterized protein